MASGDFTHQMAYGRAMDLSAQVHQLRPAFEAGAQPELFNDLRTASLQVVHRIAHVVDDAPKDVRAAMRSVKVALRELETLTNLAAQMHIIDDASLDRLSDIYSEVHFLLKGLLKSLMI